MADTDVQTGAPDLAGMAHWIVTESVLINDEGSPFDATITPGDPRLLVIAGENASGKSLLFRVLCAQVRKAGALPVSLSIRERTGSGSGDMSRMRQVMMYGDESDQSTGAVSVQTVLTGFGNIDRDGGSILALDEPELGLSDGYAHALGQLIGQRSRTTPDGCGGVVVVTHSRSLVRGIVAEIGAAPTFVHVGSSEQLDVDTWLTRPEPRTVEDLLALPEIGRARFRQANQLLNPRA